MKILGIYTKNFSLYHDIVTTLRRRGLTYIGLSKPRDIPERIGIVLTSADESRFFKSKKFLSVDSYDSIDLAIDAALQKLTGKELYSMLYIGIDPGERPGLAIVGDNILIQKLQVESPEKVYGVVKRLLELYPSKECCIRVGHGSTLARNRIINSMISLEVPIEIVDETRTTSAQQSRRHNRDSDSAASIALVAGGRVQQKLPLDVTKGTIKNIQKRSRELTMGRYSISEELAIQVLKGSISLQEAIEKDLQKKKDQF